MKPLAPGKRRMAAQRRRALLAPHRFDTKDANVRWPPSESRRTCVKTQEET
jgi:hypothetical protein